MSLKFRLRYVLVFSDGCALIGGDPVRCSSSVLGPRRWCQRLLHSLAAQACPQNDSISRPFLRTAMAHDTCCHQLTSAEQSLSFGSTMNIASATARGCLQQSSVRKEPVQLYCAPCSWPHDSGRVVSGPLTICDERSTHLQKRAFS